MHALDIRPRILVELACSFASRRDLSLGLWFGICFFAV